MNRKRPKQIVIRVTEQEASCIKLLAAINKKTQQEYLINAALQAKIVNLDGLKKIYPELKKQGSNLNQIAKTLNARGYVDYKNELPSALKEVRETWQSLRQYLQEHQ